MRIICEPTVASFSQHRTFITIPLQCCAHIFDDIKSPDQVKAFMLGKGIICLLLQFL